VLIAGAGAKVGWGWGQAHLNRKAIYLKKIQVFVSRRVDTGIFSNFSTSLTCLAPILLWSDQSNKF
jgi:hypothetical protein